MDCCLCCWWHTWQLWWWKCNLDIFCCIGSFDHTTALWCVTGGRWTIKLGNITLSVKQGDITRESTDAIVNSSNSQLQLDQGDAAYFSLMNQVHCRHHTLPLVCSLLPLYMTTKSDSVAPLVNTLEILTTCYSTIPTSMHDMAHFVKKWNGPQNWKYITDCIIQHISYCCGWRTEPRPQVTRTENFVKVGHVVFEIWECRDKHTDTKITILCITLGGGRERSDSMIANA